MIGWSGRQTTSSSSHALAEAPSRPRRPTPERSRSSGPGVPTRTSRSAMLPAASAGSCLVAALRPGRPAGHRRPGHAAGARTSAGERGLAAVREFHRYLVRLEVLPVEVLDGLHQVVDDWYLPRKRTARRPRHGCVCGRGRSAISDRPSSRLTAPRTRRPSRCGEPAAPRGTGWSSAGCPTRPATRRNRRPVARRCPSHRRMPPRRRCQTTGPHLHVVTSDKASSRPGCLDSSRPARAAVATPFSSSPRRRDRQARRHRDPHAARRSRRGPSVLTPAGHAPGRGAMHRSTR